MNLDQVRTFRLAAELESFSKAADEQFLSQPAVSLQIRQLERELGVTLFERNGKRIKLTRAGHIFLAYAQQLESLTGELRHDLQALSDDSSSVSIGCSPTSSRHFMPALLAELRAICPGVHARVVVLPTDQGAAALARGELDFIFTTDPVAPSRVTLEECMTSRIHIVAPAGHPLTRAARVTPEQVARYPFALLPPPYQGPQLFKRWAENHGVEIRVVLEMGGYDGLMEAVRQGVGLSLISETALADELQAGRIGIVRAVGMPLEFPIFLAHRTSMQLSTGAAALRQCVLHGKWKAQLPHLPPMVTRDSSGRAAESIA